MDDMLCILTDVRISDANASDLQSRRYVIANVSGMDAASRRWWKQVY
ncbi:hypothetical protein [Paenibacillus sp. R14(2021)]|nr:hypothetical protein [Paenibacillus sp. R14(2021)]